MQVHGRVMLSRSSAKSNKCRSSEDHFVVTVWERADTPCDETCAMWMSSLCGQKQGGPHHKQHSMTCAAAMAHLDAKGRTLSMENRSSSILASQQCFERIILN